MSEVKTSKTIFKRLECEASFNPIKVATFFRENKWFVESIDLLKKTIVFKKSGSTWSVKLDSSDENDKKLRIIPTAATYTTEAIDAMFLTSEECAAFAMLCSYPFKEVSSMLINIL